MEKAKLPNKPYTTILVTGGYGLVGRALASISSSEPDKRYQWVYASHNSIDLSNYNHVNKYLAIIKPDIIIHLAANVGGLFKNLHNNIKMFENNLTINYNIIKLANLHKVKTVVCCLSTCIFPDKIDYPIDVDKMHNGEPHQSNLGYSYAKRMAEVQCRLYNQDPTNQTRYICITPTNIYGPADNFSIQDGHVIPSLIHKCYSSIVNNVPFEVKGDGTPLRQFIYSRDVALIIRKLIFSPSRDSNSEENKTASLETNRSSEAGTNSEENKRLSLENTNYLISPPVEHSIKDVASMIYDKMCKELGKETSIEFGTSEDNGQYKKTAVFKDYGIEYTPLEEGIYKTIKWFIVNYKIARV